MSTERAIDLEKFKRWIEDAIYFYETGRQADAARELRSALVYARSRSERIRNAETQIIKEAAHGS